MNDSTFDPAQQLNLHARRARVASKVLTFLSSGGAYDISAIVFQLNIKQGGSSTLNVIQLLAGSGLTISGDDNNKLTIVLSEVQTELTEGIYYWELYNASTKKTWLCGKFYVFTGVHAETENELEITINTEPDTIEISVSDSSSVVTEIDGGSL